MSCLCICFEELYLELIVGLGEFVVGLGCSGLLGFTLDFICFFKV